MERERGELSQLRLITARAWDEFESTADREVVETIKEVLSAKGRKVKLKTLRRKLPEHQSAWLEVILAAFREEAKILGLYAKERSEIELKGATELRYAGRSVNDVNQEMLSRIIARVEERRTYEAGVKKFEAERN